jgi:hypothetical protein
MTFFFFLGLIMMIGVELNSVLYPVPIDLPGKDSYAVAPPESGPGGERRHMASNGQTPNGRRGIPARAALGLAVVASVVGVLLGRRGTNSE